MESLLKLCWLVLSIVSVVTVLFSAGCGDYRGASASGTIHDRGWSSPWIFAGGSEHDKGKDARENLCARSGIAVEGDMALVTMGTGVLERHFPAVSSGILKIQIHVRLENPTIVINQPNDSVLKVYASDADKPGGWAFRWHYPYAWPEVGGNTVPRFYVADGSGAKRKGLWPTDFYIEADTWYKVDAVLNFDNRTWEFWVDDVKLDAVGKFGHELSWWQSATKLSNLRITSVYAGRNWIDAITISHNGKVIASTGFNSADGYEDGKSIVSPPVEPKQD